MCYPEQCDEFLVENSIDVPEETCNIEPTRECRDVTTRYGQILSAAISNASYHVHKVFLCFKIFLAYHS